MAEVAITALSRRCFEHRHQSRMLGALKCWSAHRRVCLAQTGSEKHGER